MVISISAHSARYCPRSTARPYREYGCWLRILAEFASRTYQFSCNGFSTRAVIAPNGYRRVRGVHNSRRCVCRRVSPKAHVYSVVVHISRLLQSQGASKTPLAPHQTLTGAACLPAVPLDRFLSVSFAYRLLLNRTVGYLRRSIEERLVMGGLVFSGPAGSGKSALLKVREGKEQGGGGNACSQIYFVTRC